MQCSEDSEPPLSAPDADGVGHPRCLSGCLGVPTTHPEDGMQIGGLSFEVQAGIAPMDSSGFEPEAPRLQSGCSTS
jgi:hypothetical protein